MNFSKKQKNNKRNSLRKIPNNQVVQGLQGLVWKVSLMAFNPPSPNPN